MTITVIRFAFDGNSENYPSGTLMRDYYNAPEQWSLAEVMHIDMGERSTMAMATHKAIASWRADGTWNPGDFVVTVMGNTQHWAMPFGCTMDTIMTQSHVGFCKAATDQFAKDDGTPDYEGNHVRAFKAAEKRIAISRRGY